MPNTVDQDEVVRLKEGTATLVTRGGGVEMGVRRRGSGVGKGKQDGHDMGLRNERVVEALSPDPPLDSFILRSSKVVGWRVQVFPKSGTRHLRKVLEAMNGQVPAAWRVFS